MNVQYGSIVDSLVWFYNIKCVIDRTIYVLLYTKYIQYVLYTKYICKESFHIIIMKNTLKKIVASYHC